MLGKLVAKFGVTRGSVRSFLDLAMYHKSLVTAQMVNEFWAPATYRVNLQATVLLERRLDWGQTQARLGSARLHRHPGPDLVGQPRPGPRCLAGQPARPGASPRIGSCPARLQSPPRIGLPRQADRYLASFLAPG